MLIRSLTLATLMAFTGPLLAADDINPLKQDLGKARPLVVVELDSGNDTLATLKKQLDEPATKQSFEERSMVFYTVKFGSIGAEGEKFAKDPKDSKKLTPPETNALIRALKLGAGSGTKVILVGKDGEIHKNYIRWVRLLDRDIVRDLKDNQNERTARQLSESALVKPL